MDGDSNAQVFGFNDGKGDHNSGKNPVMSYIDLDNVIDSISAGRMLITISGCGGTAPLEPLSNGHSQRIVSDIESHWLYNISEVYPKLDHAPKSGIFDLDRNGFVSLDEIVKTVPKYATVNPSAHISDKDGIATTFYLGDFKVNDQS